MSDEPRLLYLEPDDEITSVVRRLGELDPGKVIVVVPGRSRATSSLVALRLLARVAAAGGRELALVADAPTRALAVDAGIAAFATLADATAGTATPSAGGPRAPIRVVRGAGQSVTSSQGAQGGQGPPGTGSPPSARAIGSDETVTVRLPRPGGGAGGVTGGLDTRPGAPRRRGPARRVLLVLLAVGIVAVAALLPGATVRVAQTSVAVGPTRYSVTAAVAGHQAGHLTSTQQGSATGQRLDQLSATGTVTFFNWNLVTVAVPLGTHASVQGGVAFSTNKRIVVAKGHFNGTTIDPGRGSVAVTAVAGGPTGNVAAEAIDTVDDSTVRGFLRGSPDNPNRLVINAAATAGGSETPHQVVQQSDVDALLTAVRDDLAAQLATRLGTVAGAVYAAPAAIEQPQITVPPDLVGTEDQPTISLTGTLDFDRAYAQLADVEAAARQAFSEALPAIPAGTAIVPDSVAMLVESAALNGAAFTAEVRVTARAANVIDEATIRSLVAGLSIADAGRALSDYEDVQIDLWPPWVDHLPQIGLRITVRAVQPAP
jgi:hypothetical protein